MADQLHSTARHETLPLSYVPPGQERPRHAHHGRHHHQGRTANNGAPTPAPQSEPMGTSPLGKRDEARRFYQVLAGLLVTVSTTPLVALPSQPENTHLFYNLHTASVFLMFCAGFVLLVTEGATIMMNEDMTVWVQNRATWVVYGSFLQVFVLRSFLQLPRSTLTSAGLLFIVILLVYGALPLLPKWIKHMTSFPWLLSSESKYYDNL